MLISKKYIPFAALFFFQSLSRGLMLSVIPIQALSIFGDAQRISVLLFLVSIGGILAVLTVPKMIDRLGGYRAFMFGGSMMLISLLLLSFEDTVLFSIGLFFHVFAIAAVEVCLTLYALSRVPRFELTQFEPMRAFSTVSALGVGPFTGVWLAEKIGHGSPFILSAVFVLISVLYFRHLGLHELTLHQSGELKGNPLRYFWTYMKR